MKSQTIKGKSKISDHIKLHELKTKRSLYIYFIPLDYEMSQLFVSWREENFRCLDGGKSLRFDTTFSLMLNFFFVFIINEYEIVKILKFSFVLKECPPATDGMERFACPTPDRQGRYRCIDDHVLCDGFIDCPEGADEDRQACMFYKTVSIFHMDN